MIVDELVISGYVNKLPHPHDRRSQLVRLTSAGVDVTDSTTDAALSRWNAASMTLGEDTMASLVRALQKIGRDGTPRAVW